MTAKQPDRTILCTEDEQDEPDVVILAPPPSKRQKVGSKNFRVQAKKFFLTYPKNETTSEVAMKAILTKFPKLKWCIVAQEAHKDETHHLHVALWLNSTVDYRNRDYWDFVTGKKGNYQVARDIVRVVKYVTKENKYLCYQIDPPTWLKAKKKKTGTSFELVAKLMQDGKSLDDLDAIYPGMIAMNLQKLQKYKKFLVKKERKAMKAVLDEWEALGILALPQDFRPLGLWLNSNLSGAKRPFKQKQLWLHGKSNLGKTTLVEKLMRFFRVYMVPMDSKSLDDYEDAEYDLIVLDEFKGQKSITWMNGFVQGGHFPVHRRYNSTLKVLNLPVIVLSNYTIDQAYERVSHFTPERLDSIKNRFFQCHVTSYIELGL